MSDISRPVAMLLVRAALENGSQSSWPELALKALAEVPMSCTTALEQCLDEVRASNLSLQRFADSLAAHHDFDALKLFLAHGSPDVRLHAARKLALCGGPDQLKLIEAVARTESDGYVATQMIKAVKARLVRAGTLPTVSLKPLTRSERTLIRLLGDQDVTWRDADDLVMLALHNTSRVREVAKSRLQALRETAVVAVTAALDLPRDGVDTESLWELLFELDRPSVLRRLRARVANQIGIDGKTLALLPRDGGVEAAEILVDALALAAPDKRHQHREALVTMAPVALRPLSRAMREDERVRGHEGLLLARIGGELVIDQLVSGLCQSDDVDTRADFVRALRQTGDPAVPALLAAYRYSISAARVRILPVLGELATRAAFDLLREVAQRAGEEQATAVAALGTDPTSSSATIIRAAARSGEPRLRAAAACAQSSWSHEAALQSLCELAVDVSADVRKEAFRAMSVIASRERRSARAVSEALLQLPLPDEPEALADHVIGLVVEILRKIGELELIEDRIASGQLDSRLSPVADQIRHDTQRGLVSPGPHALFVHVPDDALESVSSEALADPPGEPITDEVHFSVTAPSVVARETPFSLDVWAHRAPDREQVLTRAKEELGTDRVHRRTVGPALIERQSSLRAVVSIPDFQYLDEGTLFWSGGISNCSFQVAIPEAARQGLHHGSVEVRMGPVRISRLHFVIVVGQHSFEAESRTVHEERVKTAFASYSREDRDAVLARLQGMLKLVPTIDVYLDVLSLRSGEDWKRRIEEEIVARDSLFLFWSRHASASRWVEHEWRIALARRGLEFIDPVPLESANLAPPPQELAALHFDEWTIELGGR